MKKLFLACAVGMMLLLSACGDGDDSLLDIFIPNISNQWQSSRNSRFFFSPENRDVNETTFTGSEQNGDFSEFTGKFKNYDIEFTFTDGDEAGVKYTGKFIKDSKPLKIVVKGTNNTELVLIQN